MTPRRWLTGRWLALSAAALLGLLVTAGCGASLAAAPTTPATSAPVHARTHTHSHHHTAPAAHLTTPQVTTTTTEPVPAGPGRLGVTVANPPSDWTVSGCEIINVVANTPAASAGLVGAQNRTDPVGDVISQVSSGGQSQTITSCGSFLSFMHGTHPGQQVTLNYWHRHVFIFGHWVARQVTVTLASPQSGGACPPPIRGRVTSATSGNRIRITVEVVGPNGTVPVHAILDTGAGLTMFPNRVLAAAGFSSYSQTTVSGVVPGANTAANLYSLPAGSLQINDQGTFVPLTTGTLDPVAGVLGATSGSLDRLIGPDVLTLGTSLVVSGSNWTITPPCAG